MIHTNSYFYTFWLYFNLINEAFLSCGLRLLKRKTPYYHNPLYRLVKEVKWGSGGVIESDSKLSPAACQDRNLTKVPSSQEGHSNNDDE